MPLQATSGAASYDGFGGGVPFTPTYIEEIFSTTLYTGNGSTQTITNGIDLSTKGGLVWLKSRSASGNNILEDSARGFGVNYLYTNSTDAALGDGNFIISGTSTTGFSLGNSGANLNGTTFASWTFRKQAKFFDVVTYTGNGTTQNIAHNLGSTPGCIIVKSTNNTFSWGVYHRSYPNGYLFLNSTNAGDTANAQNMWGNNSTVVAPTSTQFTVGSFGTVNSSGTTYVAYLFAHDAGGFGLTGTDNVITCGSVATNGLNSYDINLGYEPQWLLIKNATTASNWYLVDNMRGLPVGSAGRVLYPNTSGSEGNLNGISLNATGFNFDSQPFGSGTYIYIAIRRGPMRTPTSGTSVFSPLANNNSTGTKNTTNFPVDMQINTLTAGDNRDVVDRLRGVSTNATAQASSLVTNNTDPENTSNLRSLFWDNTGFQTPAYYGGSPAFTALYYNFRRAPGFFDVVCYTGTGSSPRSINHNLGVAPQLWIVKSRTAGATLPDWWIGTSVLPLFTAQVDLNFDTTAAQTNNNVWNDTLPTSTVFYTGNALFANENGYDYVAYLFASCPGVSKVGSYTGTGALQTVNCGFTGGARFVLIKRTDSTGDWWVYDSVRGISSGSDPYLFLNSTAAQVTNTNYVDTTSVGFQVTAAAPAGLNANGGTYIFLAIA